MTGEASEMFLETILSREIYIVPLYFGQQSLWGVFSR